MKSKTVFYCTECGNETPKWVGKCPACGSWNTVVEQPAEPKKRSASAQARSAVRSVPLNRPKPIREVETTNELRFQTGLSELDGLLNGTTSLALCSDPVAPARVMANYAKKLNDKFEIKGGFMDGKPVDLATINSLASIPALPVLQAQVLGTMLAPISGLACVLKQIAEKMEAGAEAPAAEAAPAAE